MYSQNNEEQIILNALKDVNGRFLEIGAFHPKHLSNTRALVEAGWHGVYVEPSIGCMKGFITEYQDNEKIELAMFAIAPKRKVSVFHEADAVSTLIDAHRELWNNTVSYQPTIVQCITMPDLCAMYGRRFEFINIDVEGCNYEVLTATPEDVLDYTKVICVEHEGKAEEMIMFLEHFHFKKIAENPENIILTKD